MASTLARFGNFSGWIVFGNVHRFPASLNSTGQSSKKFPLRGHFRVTAGLADLENTDAGIHAATAREVSRNFPEAAGTKTGIVSVLISAEDFSNASSCEVNRHNSS